MTEEQYNQMLYKEVDTESVLNQDKETILQIFENIVKVQEQEAER